MSVFQKYSTYYDLIYKDKDYPQESQFIRGKIKKYAPNAKTLIEFGSGSGHHAELLAPHFDTIDGVDLSPAMVEIAQTRKQNSPHKDKLSFQTGNITDVNLNKKADALISLFHVISYLNENETLLTTLKNIRNHLHKDGIFVFDFWYGPAVWNLRPEKRTKVMENEELKIIRDTTPVHHINKNVVDVIFDMKIQSKKDNSEEELREVHPMRYFFLPELYNYLEQTGFELLETGEWLTSQEPSENTWGVYMVAKAK